MRHLPRALLAAGLGFAVSFLVACGGGAGLLSGNDSANLNSQLDSVSSAVAARNCPAAASALSRLGNQVDNLPGKVSPTLRANLAQGVATVSQLASRDCHRSTTTSTASTASTSTTTPSTTTTTHSTTSTTTPSTSTTTTTSTSTTTPATTTTTPGTTSTTGGTGGAGLGGGGGGGGATGGAGAGNGGSGQ
jgi:hypothetical protein